MNAPDLKPTFRSSLLQNWISLTGVVIALGSWFAFFLLLTIDYFSKKENPYLGILTSLVAPFFLLLGLSFVAVGWLNHRRQVARLASGVAVTRIVIDLSRPRDRRLLVGFIAGSIFFLVLTSIGSYQTYRVTESVQFCGQACHSVMEPQYVAYQHSPHAQVECTACHIGPGAQSFLKAKFNGLHQVYATIFDKYERPVYGHGKIAINQQTCEQCHWPQKYHGNLDRTYSHYLTDATNTPYTVRLLLKVGGGDTTHGPAGGIHWHMNLSNKVEYIATDALRQKIPWVRLTTAQGEVREFRSPDFKDDPQTHPLRTMDCMDCHNRPAHDFRLPTDAVDLAMSLGKISTKLPAVKK